MGHALFVNGYCGIANRRLEQLHLQSWIHRAGQPIFWYPKMDLLCSMATFRLNGSDTQPLNTGNVAAEPGKRYRNPGTIDANSHFETRFLCLREPADETV